MRSGGFRISPRWLICMLVWAYCCVVAASENTITTADKSVLRVIARKGENYTSGTSFVLGAGDVVATNNHVISLSDEVFLVVKQNDGKLRELQANVVWTSIDYDLALLKVPGLGRPPLQISDQLPVKGSLVTAIGYPGVADRGDKKLTNNFVESTVTQGIVGRVVMSSWRKDGLQLNILQHGAAVNSGNSGGPLLDSCGRVVGVNTAKALGKIEGNEVNQTDGIFFASHIAVLLEAIKQQGLTPLVTSENCPPTGVQATQQSVSSPVVALLVEATWAVPLAIGAAVLLAFGALVISLKKSVTVRETFTQFKRRAGSQQIEPRVVNKTPKWHFRGHDSQHQPVKLVVDAASCQASPLIIGRDGGLCQLVIDDPTVSRRHASVIFSVGQLHLADLDSTNGTWVDGAPVTKKTITLRHGQTLKLGKVVLNVEESFS